MNKHGTDPVAVAQRVMDDNRNLIDRLSSDLDSARSDLLLMQDRTLRLQHELEAALTAATAARRERDELVTGVERFRRDGEKNAAQITTIESQNTHLANLYVTCYRLLGTLDRNEVIEAIKEVVINIIGSENFVIIETAGNGMAPKVIGGHGERAEAGDEFHPLPEPVIHALQNGQSYVATQDNAALAACVPLRLESRVTGALLIFRLLPQKSSIDAADLEMLDLLSTHAANALHLTSLHHKTPQKS
jgi:GAF domain-containing protein